MPEISIDNEVFLFLQKQAIPFEETTPNMVLRRLLKLDSIESKSQSKYKKMSLNNAVDLMVEESTALTIQKKKRPKTNCKILIRGGYLSEGEKLFFQDYKENIHNDISAILHGTKLVYNDEEYSLSLLAAKCFKDIGYSDTAVRGPAHWVNNKGESIQSIWEQYLIDTAPKLLNK